MAKIPGLEIQKQHWRKRERERESDRQTDRQMDVDKNRQTQGQSRCPVYSFCLTLLKDFGRILL